MKRLNRPHYKFQHYLWIFSIAISGIALIAFVQDPDQIKFSEIAKIMSKQDTQISFYGKVVDQTNSPVQQASVEAHVIYFNPLNPKALFCGVKKFTLVTDSLGMFKVEGQRGKSFYVEGISKDGYDGLGINWDKRSFEYSTNAGHTSFTPDENSPVVFQIRKQEALTFCIEERYWSSQIMAMGGCRGSDFITRNPIPNLNNPIYDGEILTCDLQVCATRDTNSSTWQVVLTPGNTNGGILASEQMLNVAPETGYQPELRFVSKDREPPNPKYIYLRSREPAIYTRLAVEHVGANEEFFRLSCKVLTNPYGNRNFDVPNNIPYEIEKHLEDEVLVAFSKNMRPAEPNIKALIEESK